MLKEINGASKDAWSRSAGASSLVRASYKEMVLHSSLPTPITELLDYEEFCRLDTAALVTSGV